MTFGDGRAEIVKLKDCPACDGRGWFLINPFATGGTNGAGGAGNMRQCETCLRAKEYWDRHGELPSDVVSKIADKQALERDRKQPHRATARGAVSQ